MALDPITLKNIENYISKAKVKIPWSIDYDEAQELFKTARLDPQRGNQIWKMVNLSNSVQLNRPQFIILIQLIKLAKNSFFHETLPKEYNDFIIEYENQQAGEENLKKQEALMQKEAFDKCAVLIQTLTTNCLKKSKEIDQQNVQNYEALKTAVV